MKNNLAFWLGAAHLKGVGPGKFLGLFSQFNGISELFTLSAKELIARGLHERFVTALKNLDWALVEKDLAWQAQRDCAVVTYDDPTYPAYLRQISDPPLVLFVKGNQTALNTAQIAIVGARNATPQGLVNASQFARMLAQAGFTITSGLALGVDGAAHLGALAQQGVTIGVAGNGLEHIYPHTHKQLHETILLNHGAIISEFPVGTPPQPRNFPRRNRIIAGLSRGVLVIEAALKSGSLITARHALDQGREVFAIPGSIHNLLARGCHHLIRQGAKLVETVEDILEEIGNFSKLSAPLVQSEELSLTKEERTVLRQVEYDITSLDVIALRSGLTVSEVSSILLTLELRGYVQSVTGGYIRVIQR